MCFRLTFNISSIAIPFGYPCWFGNREGFFSRLTPDLHFSVGRENSSKHIRNNVNRWCRPETKFGSIVPEIVGQQSVIHRFGLANVFLQVHVYCTVRVFVHTHTFLALMNPWNSHKSTIIYREDEPVYSFAPSFTLILMFLLFVVVPAHNLKLVVLATTITTTIIIIITRIMCDMVMACF